MRNRVYIWLLSIPVILFSCKNDKKSTLTRTWYATNLENPLMDTMMKQGQMFIDTVGKNTDAATNAATYGVTNMDSLRHVLQTQFDSVKHLQDEALKQTVFTFRKDGIALLAFSGRTDSAKWMLDKDGNLILDEITASGRGNKIKMEVVELNNDQLKLKFNVNNSSSTVTFKPGMK